MEKIYLRGDIYWADLDEGIGSEQSGTRPVIILQNNIGNRYSTTVIVAPITSQTKKKNNQPTHCIVDNIVGLNGSSVILTEQIRTIDKLRLSAYIGHLPAHHMERLNQALAISVGLSTSNCQSANSGNTPGSQAMTLCLCHSCVSSFFETGSYYIKRANPLDVETDIYTYCNRKRGYDYLIREKLQH